MSITTSSSPSEPTEEIRAFHCPVCGRLIEIDPQSRLYVKLTGVLRWGEDADTIAAATGNTPYRICRECFANWGRENHLRGIEVPPLREGTKIRPL